jgi:iron complex transport system ATP-binding protein
MAVPATSCETIRMECLSIGYPGKNGLHVVANRIHTSLMSGELTCLLGANGTGKSTLLRTLSGFQPPLSGKILLSGRDIKLYTRLHLATLISVVLTDRAEVNGMTVEELVSLGRTPYTGFWGKLKEEDQDIVNRSLSLVGISNLTRRRIETLSDGERQKAMVAKALAQETPVILLDEPTAFLDFPSKVELLQLLRQLCRETNKSILLSTHDLELALQIADKVWLMEKSKELVTGTPEDLALNGKLTHFFKRKGVLFDEHTGLFCVDNSIEHHIRLTGSGERFDMVRKALIRNGVDVDGNGDARLGVEVTDTGYILLSDGKSVAEVTSIEQLLLKVYPLLPMLPVNS